MTFEECYHKALEENAYEYKIIKYNPNGTVNTTFENYHDMIYINGKNQTPKEECTIPISWLYSDNWELEIQAK